MKSFLFSFVALSVAVTVAPQNLGLLPYDPFQDDPIDSQLGQLTEFEQDDAEALPQQQQQQQDEEQQQQPELEQPQQQEEPQQQQQQQEQQQQFDDGFDDEFDAFREEPQFEQQNAPLQEAEEPQLEQLNVNRQATSEPQLQQLKKKKNEEFKLKKSTSLGAVGLGGSGTPVDLKYEKKIIIKAHPKFKYQYQVHDKKTKDIKSKKEQRDGHKLRGEYKLLQPDHLWRHVKYSSDKKQGWIAHVTYSKG